MTTPPPELSIEKKKFIAEKILNPESDVGGTVHHKIKDPSLSAFMELKDYNPLTNEQQFVELWNKLSYEQRIRILELLNKKLYVIHGPIYTLNIINIFLNYKSKVIEAILEVFGYVEGEG